MNIILHIGQSKTGTTALQSLLCRDRKKLREHGYLYPDYFVRNMPLEVLNHNAFANSILGFQFFPRLEAPEYWRQFNEQFSAGKYGHMVLSAESFFGGRPHPWELASVEEYWESQRKKLRLLSEMLNGNNVKIIVYLRRQDKWLESAIQHIIRFEGTLGQKVYESDRQIMDMLQPSMDYIKTISLWDEIIKPSSIDVVAYERKNFPQGNVSADFVKRIGLGNVDFEYSAPTDLLNTSWSTEFIEAKKRINRTERTRSQEDAIIDIITALDEKSGSNKKYVLAPELKKEILDNAHEGNAAMSRKYAGKDSIFSQDRDAGVQVPSVFVDEEDVQRALCAFEEAYRSPYGRAVLLKHILARKLRTYSPALHTFLAPSWRKARDVRKRKAARA